MTMIYEEIMYGVKCDRCYEIYENGDGCTVSSDKHDMEEEACENDWQEIDGRHYCPDCYTRDENDEDKIIVKPLIHYSFFKFQSLVNQLTGCHHRMSQDDTHFILRNNYCYKRMDNPRLAILREIIPDFTLEYKVPEKQSGKPYEHEIIRIPKDFKHAI